MSWIYQNKNRKRPPQCRNYQWEKLDLIFELLWQLSVCVLWLHGARLAQTKRPWNVVVVYPVDELYCFRALCQCHIEAKSRSLASFQVLRKHWEMTCWHFVSSTVYLFSVWWGFVRNYESVWTQFGSECCRWAHTQQPNAVVRPVFESLMRLCSHTVQLFMGVTTAYYNQTHTCTFSGIIHEQNRPGRLVFFSHPMVRESRSVFMCGFAKALRPTAASSVRFLLYSWLKCSDLHQI